MFGRAGKLWRAWRAYGAFDKTTKELWRLKEAGMIKSKTVWGGIVLALVPLAKAILPLFNMPAEGVSQIVTALTAIGALLGAVGVRHAIEKSKAK